MLNANSSTYIRTGCGIPNHYYEAIQVNVDETGYYTLTSKSRIGMNIYGYLYTDNFIPNNPSMNLLLEDIYSCDNSQFKLTTYLQSNTNYISCNNIFSKCNRSILNLSIWSK